MVYHVRRYFYIAEIKRFADGKFPRIIIDMGEELPSTNRKIQMLEIEGVTSGTPNCNAVLITSICFLICLEPHRKFALQLFPYISGYSAIRFQTFQHGRRDNV